MRRLLDSCRRKRFNHSTSHRVNWNRLLALFYLSHAFGFNVFLFARMCSDDNVLLSRRSSDVGLWPILLKKSESPREVVVGL